MVFNRSESLSVFGQINLSVRLRLDQNRELCDRCYLHATAIITLFAYFDQPWYYTIYTPATAEYVVRYTAVCGRTIHASCAPFSVRKYNLAPLHLHTADSARKSSSDRIRHSKTGQTFWMCNLVNLLHVPVLLWLCVLLLYRSRII